MELPPEMVALCLSAGTVLANSMATDLWVSARRKFGAYLANNGDAASHESRLDRDRQALESADHGDRPSLQGKFAASWATRFEDLLEQNPDSAAELASLVAALQEELVSAGGVTNLGVSQKIDNGGVAIYSGRDTRISR